MGSRRNKGGSANELREFFLMVPWWVGPVFALGIYFVLGVGGAIVRSIDKGPFGLLIGGFMVNFAPFAAMFLVFVWVIAMIQKWSRGELLNSSASLDTIRKLSWEDFELLVGEALRRDGYAVSENLGGGADGGIDLWARRQGEAVIVQCKQWKSGTVGVRVVREMYGVMIAENASGVLIVTTGEFTRDALAFAEGKPIKLMNGRALTSFLGELRNDKSQAKPSGISGVEPRTKELLRCPKCNSPMILRTAKKGPTAGQQFYGCTTYPKCNGTLAAAETE